MYTIHLHDADYNDIHKYKAIGSLSQIKEDAKVQAKQRGAKHYHIYDNVTLVFQH